MFLPFASKVRQLRRKSLVGQIIVILLGMQLFFLATFSGFSLPTPTAKNLSAYIHNVLIKKLNLLPDTYQRKARALFPSLNLPPMPVRLSLYIPQAPAAIFVGCVLGPVLGAVAAGLFLLLGFTAPAAGLHIFVSGGEGKYFIQPGFGYMLGMIVASWCSGWLVNPVRRSWRQLLAVVSGVASIHILGVIYLLGSSLFISLTDPKHQMFDWLQWLFEEIRNMTWYQLPYDVIFSILVVGLAFPFRWLIEVLIAPDIAFRSKPQADFQEILSTQQEAHEFFHS